jgi:hypothetical protein
MNKDPRRGLPSAVERRRTNIPLSDKNERESSKPLPSVIDSKRRDHWENEAV